MRPALLALPPDALPAHPRYGLAGTAAVHAVVFGAIALAVVLGARRSPALSMMPATVSAVVADAAPPPPVLIVTGPSLDAVEAMPPSTGIATVDGFRYDTSRIREHRRVLFPFLTGQLPFLDELRAAAPADRQRLRNNRGSRP